MPKALVFLMALLALPLAYGGECNPAPGQRSFANKCAICHFSEAGAGHSVGPNLHEIAGRPRGKAAGFAYSEALAGAGGEWRDDLLDAFLTAPQQALPGTAMPFQGLKSAAERAALICYLKTLN